MFVRLPVHAHHGGPNVHRFWEPDSDLKISDSETHRSARSNVQRSCACVSCLYAQSKRTI